MQPSFGIVGQLAANCLRKDTSCVKVTTEKESLEFAGESHADLYDRSKCVQQVAHAMSTFCAKVGDQLKALEFCTRVLGPQEYSKVPVGEDYWLTVVSPDDKHGTQLQLDPGGHDAVKPYREALKADGIPLA